MIPRLVRLVDDHLCTVLFVLAELVAYLAMTRLGGAHR